RSRGRRLLSTGAANLDRSVYGPGSHRPGGYRRRLRMDHRTHPALARVRSAALAPARSNGSSRRPRGRDRDSAAHAGRYRPGGGRPGRPRPGIHSPAPRDRFLHRRGARPHFRSRRRAGRGGAGGGTGANGGGGGLGSRAGLPPPHVERLRRQPAGSCAVRAAGVSPRRHQAGQAAALIAPAGAGINFSAMRWPLSISRLGMLGALVLPSPLVSQATAPYVPQVPTEVVSVVTGGTWTTGRSSGVYRIVVI